MKKKGIVLAVTGLVMVLAFGFILYPVEETKGVRINRLANNAGKRVAICIGINSYEDKSFIPLEKARNDAQELGKVLREYGQFDQVYVMTDDQDPRGEFYPKLNNIKRKMAFLKEFLDPQDLVVFSFSGHGISNAQGEGFLLTADSYGEDLYGSSLKVSDITKWLKEANVKKSLLLLDACREKFQEKKSINLNGLTAERFTQAEVGAVLYSTRSGGFSYEDKQGKFGVFSRFVIEGLKGKADSSTGNNDGIVTFSELSSFVDDEVAGWALRESKKQRPYTQILGEKFGDLALSAYEKTRVPVELGEPEKKEKEKPAVAELEENVRQKEEKIAESADDKPAEVKAVETKARRVYKNKQGFWEADYGGDIIMVYIPAGEFIMGSNDGSDDEKPAQKVYLDGYWLGKTEVTVKQFRTFVLETEYQSGKKKNWKNPGFNQEDNHPVVYVSWNDAVKYCEWLSKKKGITFRLPTEAQWEKGDRGIDGWKYPWGNHDPYFIDQYYANCGPRRKDEDGFYYTAPVGSYPLGASPYGLLDMAGNAWEWCGNWYKDDYFQSAPFRNPTGPVNGERRVLRGGSWFNDGRFARSAYRSWNNPDYSFDNYGFRLAQ